MSANANIAIYDLLRGKSTPALTDLYNSLVLEDPVTGEETMKVFHQQAPTDMPRPYIVYVRNDGNHANHLLGDSGLDQAQYTFDVWGNNSLDHAEIAELLRLGINALIGIIVNSVNFRSIFVDNDIDGIFIPTDNSQKGEYRTSVTYSITYSQPKANVT